MRSIRFAKSGAFGRDRGGIPVVVENANRKLRRMAARQAAQMERAPRQAPNTKQPNTTDPSGLAVTNITKEF